MFLGRRARRPRRERVPHVFVTRPRQPKPEVTLWSGCCVDRIDHPCTRDGGGGIELSGDYSRGHSLLLCTSLPRNCRGGCGQIRSTPRSSVRRGIPWRGSLTERLARAVRARHPHPRIPCVSPDLRRNQRCAGDAAAPNVRVVYVPGDPLRAIDLHRASALSGRLPADGLTASDVAHPVVTARRKRRCSISGRSFGRTTGRDPVGTLGRLLGNGHRHPAHAARGDGPGDPASRCPLTRVVRSRASPRAETTSSSRRGIESRRSPCPRPGSARPSM